MGSKSNEQIYSKMRRSKKDLIDLSGDTDGTFGNNILDLFDPLSHNVEENPKKSEQSKTVGKPLLELKRRDRRFRESSITSSNSKNDMPLRAAQEGSAGVWRHSSSISNVSKSSTALSQNSDSSSTSTEIEAKLRINKLSSKSSSSSSIDGSIRSSRSNGDLSSALSGVALKGDDIEGSRIRLTRKHQRSSHELISLTNRIKSFTHRLHSCD